MKDSGATFSKIWRTVVTAIFLVLLIPLTITLLLGFPPIQEKAIGRVEKMLKSRTGIDLRVGQVRVNPLLELALDDVLALGEDADTLAGIGSLVLKTDLMTIRDSVLNVREFRLDDVIVDTRPFHEFPAVVGKIGRIYVKSDSTSVPDRYTLLNSLRIEDADVTFCPSDKPKEKKSSLPDWEFDAPEVSLKNVRLQIGQDGLSVSLDNLGLSASGDMDDMDFDLGGLNISGASAVIGGRRYDLDSLRVSGSMDGSGITLDKIDAASGPIALRGSASASLDSPKSSAEYDLVLTLSRFRLNDYVKTKNSCSVTGTLKAKGRGTDPMSPKTDLILLADLDRADWNGAALNDAVLSAKVSGGKVSGNFKGGAALHSEGLDFGSGVDLDFGASGLSGSRPLLVAALSLSGTGLRKDSLCLALDTLNIDISTGTEGTVAAIRTDGLDASADAAGHLLDLLPALKKLASSLPDDIGGIDVDGAKRARPISIESIDLDSLRRDFPILNLAATVRPGSPLDSIIASKGLAFGFAGVKAGLSPDGGLRLSANLSEVSRDSLSLDSADLVLQQRGSVIDCSLLAVLPPQNGLPGAVASVDGWLGDDDAELRLKAESDVKSVRNVDAGVNADITARMNDGVLSTDGALALSSLVFGGHRFGDRDVQFSVVPVPGEGYDINAVTEDLPMALLESYIPRDDIKLDGTLAANVNLHGPLNSLVLTAEAVPSGAVVRYIPLKAEFHLSDDKILLEDMKVKVPGTHVYAVDSTEAVLSGEIGVKDRLVDLALDSPRFKPAPFEKDDSTAYYGNVAAALALKIGGKPGNILVRPRRTASRNGYHLLPRKEQLRARPGLRTVRPGFSRSRETGSARRHRHKRRRNQIYPAVLSSCSVFHRPRQPRSLRRPRKESEDGRHGHAEGKGDGQR